MSLREVSDGLGWTVYAAGFIATVVAVVISASGTAIAVPRRGGSSAMPWLKWMPWRFLIRRAARAHGFLDPVALLGHLHRFSQPSEVGVPLELLRAGMVSCTRPDQQPRHQHNLDWVWPYWIERQFDPHDVSFVPRAFTITHYLTHRTGPRSVCPIFFRWPSSIRAGCTPLADGWSLDCWVVAGDGRCLLPSRAVRCEQRFDAAGCGVVTESMDAAMFLRATADMIADEGEAVCRLRLLAQADAPAWMVLALRPCNAEGVSFVHRVELAGDRSGWVVDDRHRVDFGVMADRHRASVYRDGDVHIHLLGAGEEAVAECEVGMATAAAMFRLEPGRCRELVVRIPVPEDPLQGAGTRHASSWDDSLRGCCRLTLPDARYGAVRDGTAHARHSFAARCLSWTLYLQAFLVPRCKPHHSCTVMCWSDGACGARARPFSAAPGSGSYFHSQEGEWDANGEALQIMPFLRLHGPRAQPQWRHAIRRGAHGSPASDSFTRWCAACGLLPAAFRAEPLGPTESYSWDAFWGVGGLLAAAELLSGFDSGAADEARAEADAFAIAIERSLDGVSQRLGRPAIAASPYRRLDAGAIGSLACGYPLRLYAPDDPRLLDTADFLHDNCFYQGGFFQDMIHSGINPYLTLHIAQVFSVPATCVTWI